MEKETLECPHCGGIYLHQIRATVYEREEDADQTVVTEVTRDGANVTTFPSHSSGNPSDRRQGLAITFMCEGCSAEPELAFERHKGETFVAWRLASVSLQRPRLVSGYGISRLWPA